MPGVALRATCHTLRRSLGNKLPTLCSTFRTEVDYPIGGFDHVQVVFDHEQRMARIHEALENFQQYPNVFEMQAGRRLIK